MGLLSNLFKKEEKNYAKKEQKKDINWFFSEEGKKDYDALEDLAKMGYDVDGYSKENVFTEVVKFLPNIQELNAKGERVAVSALGKCLAFIDTAEETDEWGINKRLPYSGYYNILDRTKNEFFDFICRLNHEMNHPMMINVILTYCIDDRFNFDGEDDWLFNAPFWKNEGDHFREFLDMLATFPDPVQPDRALRVLEPNKLYY